MYKAAFFKENLLKPLLQQSYFYKMVFIVTNVTEEYIMTGVLCQFINLSSNHFF